MKLAAIVWLGLSMVTKILHQLPKLQVYHLKDFHASSKITSYPTSAN